MRTSAQLSVSKMKHGSHFAKVMDDLSLIVSKIGEKFLFFKNIARQETGVHVCSIENGVFMMSDFL